MIDRFQALASKVQRLQPVAIGIGIACLAAAAYFALSPPAPESERFLLPAIIGFLWSVSATSFISIFRSVPEKADASATRWQRIRLGAWRGWYWLMALLFFGTTLAVVVVSQKLLSVWAKDYAG